MSFRTGRRRDSSLYRYPIDPRHPERGYHSMVLETVKLRNKGATLGDLLKWIESREQDLTPEQYEYYLRDNYIRSIKEDVAEYVEKRSKYLDDLRDWELTEFIDKDGEIILSTASMNPDEIVEILDFWENSVEFNRAKSVIAETNQKISRLTGYGLRREYAEKPSRIIRWANDPQRWFPSQGKEVVGEVDLDADQVLVPYDDFTVERIVGQLEGHPLWRLSLEAREKGEIDPFKQSVEWWEKQMQAKGEEDLGERYK